MFTVEVDAGQIIIRPKSKDGNDPVAYWSHDTFGTAFVTHLATNAAAGKWKFNKHTL